MGKIKKIIFTFFIPLILLTFWFGTAVSQSTILMQPAGGVYLIQCNVNGLELEFIFDTGASDVSLSLPTAKYMLQNGYLTKNDIIGTDRHADAIGNVTVGVVVILRTLQIGNITLHDVKATIIPYNNAPLLLGQSAIKMLGKYQIEGNKLTLLNSAIGVPNQPSYDIPNVYKQYSGLYVKYWKDAVRAFNHKNYETAFIDFKKVKAINDYLFGLNIGMGSKIDTMAVLNIGNSAFNMREKDTATYYYQQLADIRYTGQDFIYKVLLSQYRDKNEQKYLSVLDEAKALFPGDKDFADEEISYYSEKHDMNKLVQKLQEGVTRDPNDYNAVLNLAITYDNMANPKNDGGYLTAQPANHDELFNKAVDAYKKAISLNPDSYAANFNLGLMYYNAAAQIGRQMDQLTASAPDRAKQNAFVRQQNTILDQASPYMEKAFQILDGMDKLDPNQMIAYKNVIIGLEGIYARQNNMNKYNMVKNKLLVADQKSK